MSLRYTLLGFINYKPVTGYELKKHMDNSTNFFWNAKLSQIYPALKKLEQEGYIKSKKIPQDGPPDKKIYSITEKGKAEFISWLEQPVTEIPMQKNPDLLKSFFSGILKKEIILNQLNQQLTLHKKQLQIYQNQTSLYVKTVIEQTGLKREGVLWELVRKYGEDYEKSYIQWLEHAIKTIERSL